MIHTPSPRPITRRDALCRMGAGFGMLSFASLIADTFTFAAESPASSPWMIQDPKFKPKAKHVIFLFMNGGLSQIDSFDPKPMLEKYDGKPLPGSADFELQYGSAVLALLQFRQSRGVRRSIEGPRRSDFAFRLGRREFSRALL